MSDVVQKPEMTTLVLGASSNPSRYSYKAAHKLKEAGERFFLLGRSAGRVADHEILSEWPINQHIDIVTIYLKQANQSDYYDFIISSKPVKVIFNPGSENTELANLLKEHGIQVQMACTLVLLATGQYLSYT